MNSIILVEIRKIYSEVTHAYEISWYRSLWAFLLPHVYIPLFWPFIFLGFIAFKSQLKRSIAHLDRYREMYDCDEYFNPEENDKLYEIRRWANSSQAL